MKKFLLLFAALFTVGMTVSARNQNLIQVFTDGDWAYAITSSYYDHKVTVVHYCGKEGSEATELTIPSYATYKGDSYRVTALGVRLFSSFNNMGNDTYTHWWQHDTFTKLEKVTIPETVTDIGYKTFVGCTSLTSVYIPKYLFFPGSDAFYGCSSLQKFEGPNTKDGVLYYFSDTLVIYPPGKKGAFEIPNSVTKINRSAFEGCTDLTAVTIPNSVSEIGEKAFLGCTGLTSVTIPNSVTSIEWYTFDSCTSLTSVSIPNSVTSIGRYAFNGCTSLTSVNIPNSVSGISADCFSGCTSLTSVSIPNSVTSIGRSAFDNCASLTKIFTLSATPPRCVSEFYNVPKTAIVYIPRQSFKAYSAAFGWSHFTDFREMGSVDITLSESSISIEEGETTTLAATVTKDDDVTIESETWASSNPEVATVENGVVTAVAEGTATITYTVVDGYGCPHAEYCEVKVSSNSEVEGIVADGSDAPAEYFNLSGVRVSGEILAPGFYIKRQGGTATKVLVK